MSKIWNPGDEPLCPEHIHPARDRDAKGVHVGNIGVGIECKGSGMRMIDGKFCCDPDCGRDMSYKLKKTDDAGRKITPVSRGCDARRASKHHYTTNCEFCCLPMSEHEPSSAWIGDALSAVLEKKTNEPRRAVLAFIEKDDSVLSAWNRRYKCWGLPGGKVQPGETLEQALRRELLEETGLIPVKTELIYEAPYNEESVYVYRVTPGTYPHDRYEVEHGTPIDWQLWPTLRDGTFASFYEIMFRHFAKVGLAKQQIADENAAIERQRVERMKNYVAPVPLPSDHPDHTCHMFCDGQDGSNSECARLRRKLGYER